MELRNICNKGSAEHNTLKALVESGGSARLSPYGLQEIILQTMIMEGLIDEIPVSWSPGTHEQHITAKGRDYYNGAPLTK